MDTLIVGLVLGPLALAGGIASWYLGDRWRAERRRSDHLHRQTEEITRQLRATEQALEQIAREVVPSLQEAAHQAGEHHGVDFPLPTVLAGTAVAERLASVADALARALRQVQNEAYADTNAQIAVVREDAEAAVAKARQTAEETARAAVRSVASSLAVIASRVSRQIGEGVRRHQDDEAYATLVTIDRLVQQLLLVTQNYVLLSGGKLTRRWPATSLTDVIRTAMNPLEEIDRIKFDPSDVALTSQAVGPASHALSIMLDNALKYSPPSAVAELSVQEGYHGVTVTIDDAGLQMNREAVAEARRILGGEQRQDITALGANPRTGFPVLAILARDYGFNVDVEVPSRFRGTRVQLFLPKKLLTEVPAALRTPAPSRPALAPVPADPPDTTASGLTVRRRQPTRSLPGSAGTAKVPQSGSPAIAAAWMLGTRTSREQPPAPHPHHDEGA